MQIFLTHYEGLEFLSYYASLYHDGAFYLFGGWTGTKVSKKYKSTIARLDAQTSKWSKVGVLEYGRHGHGAIFDGEKFLIIGGEKNDGGPIKNEVCTLKELTMTCVEQATALDQYSYYPELFLVPEMFGKDVEKC